MSERITVPASPGRLRRSIGSLKSPRRAAPVAGLALLVMVAVGVIALLVPHLRTPDVSAPPASADAEQSGAAAATVHNCIVQPGRCGYPDATNSGVAAGTILVRVPEDLTEGPGWHYDQRGYVAVSEPGAVLRGVQLSVPVEVTADNVTIQDARIAVSGEVWAIALRHANGATISHVTISAAASGGRLMVGIKDIYGDTTRTTIDGCDISGTSTGVQIVAGVIKNSYIHDLKMKNGDHLNGITSNGASTPLLIQHNTVLNQYSQTDAIGLFQDFGIEANRTIIDNLLAGGGYTLYAGQNTNAPTTSHIVVTDNRFARRYFPTGGRFGHVTAWASTGPGNVWSNNIWDDTGGPASEP